MSLNTDLLREVTSGKNYGIRFLLMYERILQQVKQCNKSDFLKSEGFPVLLVIEADLDAVRGNYKIEGY